MHTVQKHTCAISMLLYCFVSERTIIDSLKLLDFLPVTGSVSDCPPMLSRTQLHESVLGAVVLLLCRSARYTNKYLFILFLIVKLFILKSKSLLQ